MKFSIIKFKFNSPLHIGSNRKDYDKGSFYIHSDTMYAAIYQTFAMLGMENEIPSEGSNDASFAISSLFPFTFPLKKEIKKVDGKEIEIFETNPVYFFPRPFIKPAFQKEENFNSKDVKKFKKVQFVDKSIFEKYLDQSNLASTVEDVKGIYHTTEKIKPDFICSDVMPRVTVPRFGGDAEPFYTERFYFKDNSGLFCLVVCTEEKKIALKKALDILKDNGIGTDRSIGNGMFDFEFDEIEINLPATASYGMNLSLFCPENIESLSEMMLDTEQKTTDMKIRYELMQRGGWMSEPYNTYRKRSVSMFKEGSVFKCNNFTNGFLIKGNLVDIKPLDTPRKIDHPVWRVGKAIFLPVNI